MGDKKRGFPDNRRADENGIDTGDMELCKKAAVSSSAGETRRDSTDAASAEDSKKGKKIANNIISSLLYQVILVAVGLLIPRLYLERYGSEINGIVTSVNQVFVYLWLLEAGIAMAALQALYRPVALGDHGTINGILSATSRYYRKTGIIYGAVVVLLALFYALAVESSLDRVTVFFLILICGAPNVLGYIVQGKYICLLQADGVNYIVMNMESVLSLSVGILKLVFLLYTGNLLLVQSVYLMVTIVKLVWLTLYMKKRYPWLDLSVEPDYQSISKRSHALVHQISALVFSNSDVVLLSIFCNFKLVSVYAIYNQFFSYIEKLITSIHNGLLFTLGQMFKTDREKFKEYFEVYESGYMLLIFAVYSVAASFLLPLIKLYTHGISDINYVDPWLLVLFLLINVLSSGKLPANQVIIFAEHFQETKYRAVAEAVINIVLSIIAIQFWGIYGGLLGTIAALLYRANDVIFYASHKLLDRSVWKTYKKWLLNASVFLVILVCTFRQQMTYASYISLFLKAALWSVNSLLLYLIVNFIGNRKDMMMLVRLVLARMNKKDNQYPEK